MVETVHLAAASAGNGCYYTGCFQLERSSNELPEVFEDSL
jgi:hypothetical protein